MTYDIKNSISWHPYSFLGASPDRLVSENGMFGLVEIKCPYSMYDKTIQEACQKPNFCCEICNATPSLKLDHEYYNII